ncbi:MAG: phosphate regulon sensor histidine kinase PhoR [Gallionellaceae bacterium]|nr:phosphate regulon sensor histidine kinase PhoR [Gallionellaceae bacterium]
MSDFWLRALVLPAISFLFCLIVWAVAGALPAALLLAALLAVQMALGGRHLAALEYWLQAPDERAVPDSAGLWESVFSRLAKLRRDNRESKERHLAALQQMEQATSALPEGVVILDDADHIEWCNPLAERHFGLDSQRDIGQQINYLVRQPEFVQYLGLREFNEPLTLRGTRKDELILSIKLVPYGSGKKLLISRDVTHLERTETMRRDFVANVSHELRTPLTVVNGFVETLHDMPDLKADMARRALSLMAEQTQRMERLVNDLLMLSRLEDALNTLQEENIAVPARMPTLLREGQSLSHKRHVLRMELDSDCGLLGNSEEFHSACGNLVSNAIRYTPQGGEIVLRWFERDGQPVFSVRDQGIGIAPEHIPRLTERFYRVDRSRSRETGGTGLGLAIVKHIANRHQAYLEVVSEEGSGSTFSLVFPAARRLELAKGN